MIDRLWIKFLVLLFAVSLIALSAAFLLKELMLGDFRQYLEGEREDRVYWVTADLEASYEKHAGWNPGLARDDAVRALMLGFEIRLLDNGGRTVMDTKTAIDLLSPSVRDRVLALSHFLSSEESDQYLPYPLFLKDREIGRLEVRFLFPRREGIFVKRTNRFLVISLFLLGGIALMLSVIFSRKLTNPIKNLLSSALAISEGDLKKRVQVPGRDELGRLASAFNRMAHSLETQEGLRKKLIANAAHELRTPVAAMRGELEAMVDGLIPSDKEQLRSLREETERLQKLIDGMEELVQAQTSGLNLRKRRVDLKQFLVSVVERTGKTTPGQRKEIGIVCEEGLTVLADPDRLGQIIINLVTNAQKAVERGGSVTVGARRADGGVIIEVKDTGSGIRKEDVPFIFERFFKATPGGLGLGLAIVKELVDAHGGTIAVESEYEKGSVFMISLPDQ